MELFAAGVLEDISRVDDIVVVYTDETVFARLAPGGPQATEGHVRPCETLLVRILTNDSKSSVNPGVGMRIHLSNAKG